MIRITRHFDHAWGARINTSRNAIYIDLGRVEIRVRYWPLGGAK